MTIRVIMWGPGVNGSSIVRGVVRHDDMELVGCRVYSEEKHGVDAGVLCGIEPIGVLATNDREEIMSIDADVVVHCPNMHGGPKSNDDDILDLLRSGKNVVTLTGAHSFPQAIPGYAEKFEQACHEGGSTFTHTGINPGMIGERILPALTGICTEVDRVTFKEIYNCRNDAAGIIQFMQFGIPLEEWTVDSPISDTFFELFYQVIHHVAHTHNIELADIKRSCNVVGAPEDIVLDELADVEQSGPIIIKKGTVAGIHMVWEGVPRRDTDFIVAKENIWVLRPDLPDFFNFEDSGWEIEIDGRPCLNTKIKLVPSADGKLNRGDCMVGAGIPVIGEVMKAPPGVLLPTVFAPFKRRFN